MHLLSYPFRLEGRDAASHQSSIQLGKISNHNKTRGSIQDLITFIIGGSIIAAQDDPSVSLGTHLYYQGWNPNRTLCRESRAGSGGYALG